MSGFFILEPGSEQKTRPVGDDSVAYDARIKINVDCEAGYGGEETPVRFHLLGHPREITQVLDRWLVLRNRNFKVMGDDGGMYVLRHALDADCWEMVLYARGEC